MNIKALVASLVLGVVGTSSAAMASPFEARREVVERREVIDHGPVFAHPGGWRDGREFRREERRDFRREERREFRRDVRRDERRDFRRDWRR